MTTSATPSLGYVAVYVLLVGVASFAEKPAGRGFGAFQLNALIRAGSLAAAAVALVFAHGLAFPASGYLLAGLGIGLITGVGSMLYCFGLNYLPVSLVVTFSNLYIVITILLGAEGPDRNPAQRPDGNRHDRGRGHRAGSQGATAADDQTHARSIGRGSHDRGRVGVLLPRPARAAGLRCLRGLECLRRRDRCAVGHLPAPTARPCPGRGDCPDTPRGNAAGPLHRLIQ